jgi:hypothetical protein
LRFKEFHMIEYSKNRKNLNYVLTIRGVQPVAIAVYLVITTIATGYPIILISITAVFTNYWLSGY